MPLTPTLITHYRFIPQTISQRTEIIEILLVAHEMGVLKLGSVSLDGTKIKANASKHHALSWDYACKLEKQLKDEIKELLRKAKQADKEDLPEGMNIPEELTRRESRLEAIAVAKTQIEQRAAERFSKEQQALRKSLPLARLKRKRPGRNPKVPPVPPQPGGSTSDSDLTDHALAGRGLRQAYYRLHAYCRKPHYPALEVKPALENFPAFPTSREKLLADTGYFSAGNVEKCETDPYIAGSGNGKCAAHGQVHEPLTGPTDSVTEMTHRLQTVLMPRENAQEPAFGIIKAVMG